MSERDTPIVHQRRLRAELRRLREAVGLTQKDVADRLEWSASKVLRVEGGNSNIGTTDLHALLHLYNVTDGAKVAELVDEARASRKPAWWTKYKVYLDPQFYTFIGYENSAVRICQFQSLTLPGLLQTSAYSEALMSSYGNPEEKVRRGVEIRRRRQEIITDTGPELRFILDEATLRRYVGTQETMRGQWTSLIERSRIKTVSIRVLPFTSGGHIGLKGSYSIIELPEPESTRILILEEPLRDVMVRDRDDEIESYASAFEHLEEVALSAEDSRTFLQQLVSESND
ncbi:helix-turn-helix domain-containing protein [Actinokineospora enzanensis]|uniref:helix-turn-helix domain-containing protein n=1 Tax=Actinokineospora enzanensis TaxID=155975 RepID=UPI000475D7DD|nr:helix-turn-helix transcriptional regulator [Actinokineospora enzanensis]